MSLSTKTRLFLILFSAGLAGVLSFLLVDLSAVLALVPVSTGGEIPIISPGIQLLSLIQPTVILALAVLAGVTLAPKVGLSAPVSEAIAGGSGAGSALKPQVIPGILGGVFGALCIVIASALFRSLFLPETIERIGKFGRLVPVPTRLLYGGITEELLLRWGFMTLLVWLAWRLFQKGRGTPKSTYFVVAILLSALVFGIGHLPIALMLLPEATAAVVLFVIVANSAFGLVAGYLYWLKGLEASILAHMCCHLVLAFASYVGAYF